MSRSSHRLRRSVALTVSAAVPVLALAGPSIAATGPTTTDRAAAGAGYLARQLVDGNHYNFPSTGGPASPDEGNTIDGVLAMDAAGVSQTAAEQAMTFLATPANVMDYLTYGGYSTANAPGSLAKLALAAEAQGIDPHSVGGINLIKSLKDEECPNSGNPACTDPTDNGYFKDPDTTGGYQSLLTQGLALVALSRTAADKPDAAAIAFTMKQRCTDGLYPSDKPASLPCTAGDVETTAFVLQGLKAAGKPDAVGLVALQGRQKLDGGFAPKNGSGTADANATAVAVQALLAAGDGAGAGRGQAFLRTLQFTCSDPEFERGAVQLVAAVDKTGAKIYDADSALRATTQAVQALAGKPLALITSTGASAGSPVLDCRTAAPTTGSSSAPSTTSSAAPASTSTTSAGSAGSAPVATAVPAGVLPFTGPAPLARMVPYLASGAGLVVLGALLLAVGGRQRRRAT